jgi:hypothetical protein
MDALVICKFSCIPPPCLKKSSSSNEFFCISAMLRTARFLKDNHSSRDLTCPIGDCEIRRVFRLRIEERRRGKIFS